MLIFHAASPADWDAARRDGHYLTSTRGATLDEVVLLHIDTDRLTSPWQLDDVPGSDEPFPHIYGALDIQAVVKTTRLRRTAEGWGLPAALAGHRIDC